MRCVRSSRRMVFETWGSRLFRCTPVGFSVQAARRRVAAAVISLRACEHGLHSEIICRRGDQGVAQP